MGTEEAAKPRTPQLQFALDTVAEKKVKNMSKYLCTDT